MTPYQRRMHGQTVLQDEALQAHSADVVWKVSSHTRCAHVCVVQVWVENQRVIHDERPRFSYVSAFLGPIIYPAPVELMATARGSVADYP
jgi:hypothetical protein